MEHRDRLRSVADDELLAGLSRIVGRRNQITAPVSGLPRRARSAAAVPGSRLSVAAATTASRRSGCASRRQGDTLPQHESAALTRKHWTRSPAETCTPLPLA